MQKEKCRFCGTRDHHPSEMHLCSAMRSSGPTDKAKAREVVSGAGSLGPSWGGERVVESPKALTAAERQKKWRDSRGDEYREWNRERMRKLRRAPKNTN